MGPLCSLKRGHIIDAIVMENRGFGFVTFEHTASAQRFLETQRHEIDEKQIEAKAAIPRHMGGSTQLTKKMFVGGTVRSFRSVDFESFYFRARLKMISFVDILKSTARSSMPPLFGGMASLVDLVS